MVTPMLLVHHCTSCTYNTTIPSTAFRWSHDCYCGHCGALSKGANIAGQISDVQQDELAQLFTQNLSLDEQQPPTSAPNQAPAAKQQEQPQQEPPRIYASAHYHHSSHVVSSNRPFSEPTRPQLQSPQDLQFPEFETILLRNSIDPASLVPSQIILFQNADADQKLRLLELWRICPPDRGQKDLADAGGIWRGTSLKIEEEMARARWEMMMRQQAEEAQAQQQRAQIREQYMDDCEVQPSVSTQTEQRTVAEPYILNGYDRTAEWYNLSTDPVYQSAKGLWEKPETVQRMEDQYGVYEQRSTGGLGFYGEFVRPGHEDDMVM